jgi:hypothetical protein
MTEDLKLPVIKKAIPPAKRLSMNEYVKFVFLNLKYTLNKKKYKKAKKMLTMSRSFSLK